MKQINITHYTDEQIKALLDEAYEQDRVIELLDEANEIEYLMSREYTILAM